MEVGDTEGSKGILGPSRVDTEHKEMGPQTHSCKDLASANHLMSLGVDSPLQASR